MDGVPNSHSDAAQGVKPAAAAPPTQATATPPAQQGAAIAPAQPRDAANAPAQGVRPGADQGQVGQTGQRPGQPANGQNGQAAANNNNNNNNGALLLPGGQRANAPVSSAVTALMHAGTQASKGRLGTVRWIPCAVKTVKDSKSLRIAI